MGSGEVVGKGLTVLAKVLRAVGLIIVAVLVIYIVLAVAGANPASGLVTFFAHAANVVSLGTQDLFLPKNPRVAVGVNYGVAAVVWLIITTIVVGLVRGIGRV